MISNYCGDYLFNNQSIENYAPEGKGIYYCGLLNQNGRLWTLYVGRAAGENVTIKNRLLAHRQNEYWSDVTHFGYVVCSTEEEAKMLEIAEIKRLLIPKYNKRLG